jgi:hypothetical protein
MPFALGEAWRKMTRAVNRPRRRAAGFLKRVLHKVSGRGVAAIETAQTTLHAAAYPHILDAVIAYADFTALLALRTVSRELRDRIDARLGRHLVVCSRRISPYGYTGWHPRLASIKQYHPVPWVPYTDVWRMELRHRVGYSADFVWQHTRIIDVHYYLGDDFQYYLEDVPSNLKEFLMLVLIGPSAVLRWPALHYLDFFSIDYGACLEPPNPGPATNPDYSRDSVDSYRSPSFQTNQYFHQAARSADRAIRHYEADDEGRFFFRLPHEGGLLRVPHVVIIVHRDHSEENRLLNSWTRPPSIQPPSFSATIGGRTPRCSLCTSTLKWWAPSGLPLRWSIVKRTLCVQGSVVFRFVIHRCLLQYTV